MDSPGNIISIFPIRPNDLVWVTAASTGLRGPLERFNFNSASWMVAYSKFRWESGTNIEGFGLPTIESGWRMGARVSTPTDTDDGDGTQNTGKERMD